jgi:hypothetical protein
MHFIGLAALLGGILTQLSSPTKRVVPAMVHGAGLMLVSGVGLYAVDDSGLHHGPPASKMAVKVAVLVVIFAVLWTQRTKAAIPEGAHFMLGGLALANVVVAVFWH